MPQDTYDFNRIDLNEIYSLFHTKDERRLDSVKEFIEAENYMKAIHKLNEFSSSNGPKTEPKARQRAHGISLPAHNRPFHRGRDNCQCAPS